MIKGFGKCIVSMPKKDKENVFPFSDCGNITESDGVITSKNWPKTYDDDMNCQIVIEPKEPGLLTLTLMDFEFETGWGGDCYDTWEVGEQI